MVLCNMPQRRHREAQDSDSIPCALICLFVLLSTWSALAIYICIWPSIKLTEVGRERIRASTEYLESVSAAEGYRLYAAHRRKELIDLLAIILNKRVPQRPLAGIVDYSRVPGARGLDLRGDRRKEISFLCKGCNYYSV